MKKTLVIAVVVLLALGSSLAAAYMAWSWNDLRQRAEQLEQLVAVSWGDGRYGPAFYGAYVYYEPRPDGQLDVKLSVRIGRATLFTRYEHDPRTLGVARDSDDAVARWSLITWTDAGLIVGAGSDAHRFPRNELERHR
jgi:hypothetical protein